MLFIGLQTAPGPIRICKMHLMSWHSIVDYHAALITFKIHKLLRNLVIPLRRSALPV